MTELTKEEKDAYWVSMKSNWLLLKKESNSTDDEKKTAKEAINKAQTALSLDVTKWDEKKFASKSSNESFGTVKWNIGGTFNKEEIKRYTDIVETAYHIVTSRHPEMDTNSNTFGTIVSSVVGHLISLRI